MQICQWFKVPGVKKETELQFTTMIPEVVGAMLACARIGAIHSVVFGGFAPDSLRDRIVDCGSSTAITANEGLRGGKLFRCYQMQEVRQLI